MISSDDDMPPSLMEHSRESLEDGEVQGRLHFGRGGYSRKSFDVIGA